MKRTESLRMWQRILSGDLEDIECNNEDLFQWIKSTAAMVLEADRESSASRRPGGLVKAIGLNGKEDPYVPLRELIQLWVDFKFDDRMLSKDIDDVFRAAIKRGVLWGEYANDEKAGKDLIRTIWPK